MMGYDILNIDLEKTLPYLVKDSKPIYGLFWWHDIPMGSVLILPDDLPLSPAALKTLAAQTIAPVVQTYLPSNTPTNFADLLSLQVLPDAILNNQTVAINSSVSVVICTRDRPQQLVSCLKSLQALYHTVDEIIVVDNAPKSTETHDVVQQFDKVRYVLEPEPGLSKARNTGIHNSHGDIIIFTDDDVRVHPNWLHHIRTAFSDNQVMAVTGIVLPTELATDSQVLFELSYGHLNNGYHPKTFDMEFFEQHQHQGVPVWDIGAGANMAFRREIFEKVGYFDLRLGAGSSGCSEDSEMWYRILAAGWHCQYVPAAVVYHTHRQDIAALRRQMKAYLQGHNVALLVQFEKFQHWGNLYRLFIELPYYYLCLFISSIRRQFKGRYRTVLAEILGQLNGLPTYFYLTYFSSSTNTDTSS